MSAEIHLVRNDVMRLLTAMDGRPNGFAPALDEAPEIVRSRFAAMVAKHDAPPREITRIADFSCPGPDGKIALRLYDTLGPPAALETARPAIIYFHGGGFVMGDLDRYDSLCRELAALTGLPAIAVDYRLAPEHPFPAAPDDTEAATRWIASHATTLSLSLHGLVLVGDSAGGNLALVTAQTLTATPAELPVLLQVPVYPLAAPVARHESYRAYRHGYLLEREGLVYFDQAYRGPSDDPRHYPVLHPELGRSPATLLVTAELDPLRDSGRVFGAALLEAGVDLTFFEIKGMIHGFLILRGTLPSAQADLERICHTILQMLEQPTK